MSARRRITLNLKVTEAQNLLGHLQDSYPSNPKRAAFLHRVKDKLLFQINKLKEQLTK